MKKCIIVSLIVAVILLAAGGSLVVYALSRTEFDWNKLTVNVENETYDYAVSSQFQDIRIDTKQADVRVVRSANSSCVVRAKVSSRDACTAETADGLLTVNCTDDPQLPWYKKFWRQDEMTVTVFLPKDKYEKLEIETGSGDMYVDDGLTFTAARTKTGSGDLELYAPVTEDLAVKSSSGDVTVKRIGCKKVSVMTSSGSVGIANCRDDSVVITSSSGDVSLADCTAASVIANTASGDLRFAQLTVTEILNVTSASGDIQLIDPTAAQIEITSKSGEVTGTLTQPMLFDVRSDSGDIEVPASGGTDRCIVRTGSGDITFVMHDSDEG